VRQHFAIVNPAAGKGRGMQATAFLRDKLRDRGVTLEILVTKRAGDATDISRGLPDRSTVVAVGGDGTANEVVNGIVGSNKILGILPAGSGNDFAKALRVSTDVEAAIGALARGKTRPVDVATVSCSANVPSLGNSAARCFVNGVGIGFDAAVASKVQRRGVLSGTLMYVSAVLQTLGQYRAPELDVSVDSQQRKGRFLLVAVGNGSCSGGGFYLTPNADAYDGLLDVCLIEDLSIVGILRIMPKVMRGNHLGNKAVELIRGGKVMVHGHSPFYVHADGEVVGRDVKRVQIELHGKIDTIVGEWE
jgi:diacylglycerol kinase (ATP)